MSVITAANCFACQEPVGGDKISCNHCGSEFHQKCLTINDNFSVWTCPKCNTGVLIVPNPPKSVRSRKSQLSHHSGKSKGSKASSKSSKAAELMKVLDEEQAMLEKQHKEQEQLLHQKHLKEQEFIQKKQQLIHDTLIEVSSSKGSSRKSVNISKEPSLTTKEKVSAWVNFNAANSTQIEVDDTSGNVALPQILMQPKSVPDPLGAAWVDPNASHSTKLNVGDQSRRVTQSQIPVQTKSVPDPLLKTTKSVPFKTTTFAEQQSFCKQLASGGGQPQINLQPQHEPHTAAQQLSSQPHISFQHQHPQQNDHQYQSFAQPKSFVNRTHPEPQLHPTANLQQQQQSTVNPGRIYLSESRVNEDAIKLTSLTKEQIAARHVTKGLPEFNGKPRDWPKFLSSFQRSTALCGFNNSENLERLSRSLKGSALAAVESSLCLDDNLPRVMETLEMLFGKPEYIINSLIEDMRQSQKPSIDCIDSIISYALEIENISTTMRLAKLAEHLWNPILLNEMVNRLPTSLILQWAEFKSNVSAPNIEVFNEWLKGKSFVYGSILSKPPTLNKSKLTKSQDKAKGYLNVHESIEPSCCVCESSCKALEDCEDFKKLGYSQRWSVIKRNSLCRTCLKKHWGRCKESQPCGLDECKYFHHKLLHKITKDLEGDDQKEAEVHAHISTKQECIFKVVPVVLKNGDHTIKTYAMLDDCSSLTLISQNIAKQLEASGPQQELCLRWTSNVKRVEYNSQILNLEIRGLDTRMQPYQIRCRSIENLNLPKQTLDYESLCKKYKYMSGLSVNSYVDAEVGILIGMNNANLLLTKGYRTGDIHDPIAAHTKLGWVIFGSCMESEGSVFHVHECDCVMSEKKLDELLKENYEIEKLGVTAHTKSIVPSEDQKAFDIWTRTLKYVNNRYEIGLLFKYEKFTLPNNQAMAKRRMYCLQKKCEREPELRDIISKQIQDYLKKGYSRIVSEEELKAWKYVWYLPIFIVRNPNKPKKVRLVWDAAATQGETSLNSVLLKGPDMLSTLFGVLLRFRQFRVAISGDIQEMFHQVHVRSEDQKYQLFLWTDSEGKIVTYAMIGMTFGASCSPATAQYIKNHNANKYKETFPRAVEAITKNHYVDDLLDSVETESEAIQLAHDVFNIHRSASFHIRNWISNSSEVSRSLNSSQDGKNLEMYSDTPMEKILGMWWRTSTDHFTYSFRYQKNNQAVWKGLKIPTKREVLRAVMSIYDPLGLLSHLLVFPRILLQNVWRESCGWDQEISSDLADDWRQWTQILPTIEQLQIPRWLGYHKEVIDPELHIFTDASKEAFAAVAYLRFKDPSSSSFRVALISAKSRVAPLKYMSVPRLELMGAVIGTRLAQTIKDNLTISIRRQIFWTDSTCVLGWINSNHRKYRPYVAARIGEILETSTSAEWRYVPTSSNVADDATRMKLVEVSSNSRWFVGPSFLFEEENQWPTRFKNEKPELEEMLSQYVAVLNVHHAEILVDKISSWIKLRRIQSFVFRFIMNLKRKVKGEKIFTSLLMSSKELRNAESTLFKQAQEEGYPEEMAILRQSGLVPKSSPVFKDSPYLDDFGVMRAHGRVDSIAGVPFSTKRPVLLPKEHRITTIIMNHFHKMFHHENSETVINELRQKFVIPAMRVKLKTIRNNCQWCKNKAATPGTVMMSALPEARLSAFSQAFTCVGIDYFGPMFVAVRRCREKRWGILITCLTTRAVHLEVAHSLSADSCIMGLRRFMCRRGVPRMIFSDNATNFKCSSKILQEAIKQIDENEVALYFTSPDTEWSFIPPASPHMGGAWERMVRNVKTTINSIFPMRYTPNDELLLSVLLEAENIINSRPLTYVPLENDLDEALTPNHFILGSSNGLKSLGNFSERGFDLRNSWSQSQVYANQLWQKWIKTILPELRRRDKWFNDGKPIKIDDIVLVIDDNAPRNCYKKARVIGLNEGNDGRVRSVTIQTTEGVYVRPITKLAVLDVHKPNEDDEERSIPSNDQGILGGSVEKPAEQQNNPTTTDTNRPVCPLPARRELRRLPHRQ